MQFLFSTNGIRPNFLPFKPLYCLNSAAIFSKHFAPLNNYPHGDGMHQRGRTHSTQTHTQMAHSLPVTNSLIWAYYLKKYIYTTCWPGKHQQLFICHYGWLSCANKVSAELPVSGGIKNVKMGHEEKTNRSLMTIVVLLVIIIINLGNSFRGRNLEKIIYREEGKRKSHVQRQIIHPSTLYQCYLIKTHISDDQLSNNIEACENVSGAPRWPVNLLMSSASMTKWSRRSEVNR